ncbi:MAG: ribonucleotide-diphosphate reductase subunit alpha, partial [Deltaproteobacteria bacterium]|nr:ribonucleotide-diphosphate reductase subunit alpha [Deltaproteobacteria bacterium]
GKSATAKTEAIGRLMSLALRSGVPVESIIEQVKGIVGEYAVFHEGGRVLSIPDAIGRVLENRYVKDKKNLKTENVNGFKTNNCPECSNVLAFEEGCKKCHYCGFSKCS